MAHGTSLIMRGTAGPAAPSMVHAHPTVGIGIAARVVGTTYRGPSRDRSLPGKARRRARKEATR